ncbi:MAG: SusC/RagA family TonB-linked outer membrane protein, partial [Prevotella sp.]
NRGTSKFSEIVLQRWTAETASIATYPRLTTENGDNNYQNSTFWLYNTDNFRLSNIQLTYNFPENSFGKTFVKGLMLYVGGTNLLTISGEREYLEMNIGAPQYRTFYIGLKANF